MRARYVVYASVVAGALALVWQFLAAANIPLLQPAGPIAAGEKHVMFLVVAFAAIAVLPTYILLFLFAWLFREGNDVAERWHLPDWDHYSTYAEVTWWLVPTIIIAALSVVSWNTSHSLDPYTAISGPEPLEVQVIALDWKWLFLYPSEGIASVNTLTLPVGRPIHFTLTADAPMNSFWIPQLGGQVMVMPGMTTQLWLRADREGTFDGYSANLSGEGFASMHFKTQAISSDAFAVWAHTAASSSALTYEHYQQLAQPGAAVMPEAFALASPGLYSRVIERYMMPRMQGADVSQQSDADAAMYSHDMMQ